MKRVLSLVLALSMVMSMFTFSFAGTSLKDVAGTEYESAVEALVELGVVNGYDDGTFLPENVVSRAEMAKLLVVAAGLAPAAELAEGTTRFSDVAADHWATGYINVAAEYGYIMGDPDGSFRPDDTVSYAEAITMALRVLGYKTVVEAKGTWPTNYIAKAEELDLLEDITYGTYATGAKRGNVALLIWNMLREDMWDVYSESEGDGLTYGKSEPMLNKKFKDYRYYTTTFDSYTIGAEAEITVNVGGVSGDSYEYTKPDFYTYVPGSEVEVLVNIKDDVLLSMVETDEYKYLAGGRTTIEEEYDEAAKNAIWNTQYSYAFTRIDGKAIVDATRLVVDSEYVYEIDTTSTKRLKYNGSNSLNYEAFEDQVVLKDGEFASVKDLEVGDVWSKVTVNGTTEDAKTFYMISGAEGEGKLTKLVEESFESNDNHKYYVATIDGEEVLVDVDAVYFVEEDDEDPANNALVADTAKHSDMKNEVVTYVTDFLGQIVVVTFDGKLNGGDEATAADESEFFALTGAVERDGSAYTITVANEDGEQELTFAKGKGNAAWINGTDYAGYFVIMTLNDDDEIEALSGDYSGEHTLVLRADKSGEAASFNTILYYNEDGDFYSVSGDAHVEFDEENNKLSGDAVTARVNDDTVVVVLVYDDMGTDKPDDDEYRVEFKDIAELDGMKNDPAVIITDNGASNFARAKYVVIFDEVSSREDDLVGIVNKVVVNKLGDTVATIVEDRDDEAKDGVEYILANGQSIGSDIQFVMYSIEENKDGEWELTMTERLANHELRSGETNHAYIPESTGDENSNVSDDGREAVITGWSSAKIDLDDEATKDMLEDARGIIVNVVLDADEDPTETQYYVDNYTEVSFADVKLKELDRFKFIMDGSDVSAVLIIRGMDARAQ